VTHNSLLFYVKTGIWVHNYNIPIRDIVCILMFYNSWGPELSHEVPQFHEQKNTLSHMDIQIPKEKSCRAKQKILAFSIKLKESLPLSFSSLGNFYGVFVRSLGILSYSRENALHEEIYFRYCLQ